MAADPKPIDVTPETQLLHLLELAEETPLLLEHHGILYRLTRADAPDASDADLSRERVLKILDQTVGSWADLDVDRVIEEVHEARRMGSRPPERH